MRLDLRASPTLPGLRERSSTRTNMPSVRAADGTSSAPRPCRRHGVARRRRARRSRAAPTRRTRRPPTVSMLVSVHTEYTRRPPGRTARAAAASISRCRPARSVASRGCTRQRASGPPAQHAEPGARRVEQDPVEARVGHRKPAAVGGDRARSIVRSSARPRITVRTRRMQIGRDHEPSSRMRSAAPVALPPGADATSSTRSPVAGRARRPRPGSPDPAA